MGNGSATIDVMPKNNNKRGRPAGRRSTVPVYARVDPELAEVWNEYIETLEPKTSSSAMVELLIKKHLRDKGLWPPTKKDK